MPQRLGETGRDTGMDFETRAAPYVGDLQWFVYPVCWPGPDGACGCGRGHEKGGKAPLPQGGYKEASTDQAQISAWSGRWPGANMAVRLDQSGLFVIDLDGEEAVAEGRALGMPTTAWSRTGNGEHWYFSRPGGLTATRSTKRGMSQGIDILADGGLILPPSRHASGRSYEWMIEPWLDLPEPPQWAIDMLGGRDRPLLGVVLEVGEVDISVPPVTLSDEGMRVWRGESYGGDRSRALASLSMHLARGGLSDAQQLVDVLGAWDRQQGDATGKGAKYAMRKDADEQYTRLAESAIAKVPEQGKPSQYVVLSDAYCENWPHTMLIDEQWYEYDAGIWVPIKKYVIERRIQQLMGDRMRPAVVLGVERALRGRLIRDMSVWDEAPDVIVCQNGAVDVYTGGIYDHSPDFYARSKAAYLYDAESIAPTWDRFIGERFEPEVARWLQEFCGICLTRDMGHEVAVWLYSPPGAGKSTFILGMRNALGPGKCGKLSLGDVMRNPRFAFVNIPGKTLLEASEQPSAYLDCSDLLNSLISGDSMTIEAKHQNAYECRPTAKILWGMNELPWLQSVSDGIFRRVKIVKMEALSVLDPGVKDRIEREGAGILRWAMQGLWRLRMSGQTLDQREPVVMRGWRESFKGANDVVGSFVEERCILDSKGKVQAQNLYDAYNSYCVRNGFRPKSRNKVSGDWLRIGLEHKVSGGRYFYWGVRLRGTDESDTVPSV